MGKILKPFLILFSSLMIANLVEADEIAEVAAVLDALHVSASRAESDAYFDLFSEDAIFIGTDVSEYWTIEEFKSYAKPVFSKGQGWTYVPGNRDIRFSDSGNTAWFHEVLDSKDFGTTRGTGVLVLEEGAGWKIAQYHLTIPIPNEIVDTLADRIKVYESEAEK